jgi:hypothetical protein
MKRRDVPSHGKGVSAGRDGQESVRLISRLLHGNRMNHIADYSRNHELMQPRSVHRQHCISLIYDVKTPSCKSLDEVLIPIEGSEFVSSRHREVPLGDRPPGQRGRFLRARCLSGADEVTGVFSFWLADRAWDPHVSVLCQVREIGIRQQYRLCARNSGHDLSWQMNVRQVCPMAGEDGFAKPFAW